MQIFNPVRDLFNFYKENKAFSILLTLYAATNLIIYLHYNVMVFDEAWFICCFSYKEFTNHLGYGYLYWLFIGLIKSKLVLRLVAFIAMMSIPIILRKFALSYNIAPNRIIVLWLTFPAAWWYGKLIAPELYCLSLAFYGLYLAITAKSFTNKKYCGLVLMGIASGIKITFIIIPLFYYFHSLLKHCEEIKITEEFFSTNLKRYLKEEKFGAFFIFGFLVGSPSLMINPKLYLDNMLKFSSSSITPGNIKFLYSNYLGDFWETVINPSLTWFSISLPSLLILITFLIFKKEPIRDKKILYGFILTSIAFLVMLLKFTSLISWYFYPIIVLFLLLLINCNLSKLAFTLIIISNFFVNSPVIFAQLTDKISHIKNYYNLPEIEKYIAFQKEEFSKKNQNYDSCIAIDPPSGSCIIGVSNLLSSENQKPLFFAFSKVMIIGDNSSIFSHLVETFNGDKVERFKEKKDGINLVGSYKDVYIFTYVPNQ